MSKPNENGSEHSEFTISRVFDAPIDLVWKVHTDPEHLMNWWGPKGFKVSAAKMDLRPGGMFHYGLTAPDGKTMWGRFVYREIVPPTKLVSVVSFSDENAGITRNPMAPTWPLEILSVMTLTKEGSKTKMTITGTPINATQEERDMYRGAAAGMNQGFKGTYDQFEEYISTLQSPKQ